MPQGLDPRSKMEVVPKMAWHTREAQTWDNPEGSELDPADDVSTP